MNNIPLDSNKVAKESSYDETEYRKETPLKLHKSQETLFDHEERIEKIAD